MQDFTIRQSVLCLLPSPRLLSLHHVQGSKFGLCGGRDATKDFEIHYPIHVDCLRSMSMDGNRILYHSLCCHYLVRVHLDVSGACPQARCQFT